jgi:hypothetical protein
MNQIAIRPSSFFDATTTSEPFQSKRAYFDVEFVSLPLKPGWATRENFDK